MLAYFVGGVAVYVVLGADELPCHVPWEGCQNLSSPVARIFGQQKSTGRSGKDVRGAYNGPVVLYTGH